MKTKTAYKLALIFVIGLFAVAQAAELRPVALDNPQQVQQPQQPKQARPQSPNQVQPSQPQSPAKEPNNVKFPYVGEVTGDQINLRSGPGMNFYSCGKVGSPLRVIIVDQKYSWSKILPPPGSFSWIFKPCVQIDPNNPNVGEVNADNVHVYAGSDELEPMRCDSVQLTVSKGLKVRIIGQPIGDYYKIAPPEGACLWMTSQYIKYVRSADDIDVKIPQAKDANAAKPELITEQVEPKNRWLEQYYTLKNQVEDEKKKPLEEQDFTKIKPEVEKLIAEPNTGLAGEYATYLLKDIERSELAKASIAELENQKKELEQNITKIEESHQQELQKIAEADISKYAVTGILKQSFIYEGQPAVKRYLVVDGSDNPICYAEAVGEMADANLSDYFSQKVGLIGQILTDPQSHLSLVKFEKIEKLEKSAAQNTESTEKK